MSPPRGRPPEATGGREAYLRPGTPVVHSLSKSSHASADSRGRLAPTSGRRVKHRPGTARLPRAGSGSASAGFFARACARVRFSGARAKCLARWAGTATGRGHLYLCWPATATSASGTTADRNLAALDRHLPFRRGRSPVACGSPGQASWLQESLCSKNYNGHLSVRVAGNHVSYK